MRLPGRPARARALVLSGGAAATSGVWVLGGDGWALVTGGVLAVAYGLLLMDVDGEG